MDSLNLYPEMVAAIGKDKPKSHIPMGNGMLLLTCLCAVSVATAQDQVKVLYGFDRAGNQTSDNRICINCPDDVVAVSDSTVVVTPEREDLLFDDDGEDPSRSSIFAYPNPVTQTLRVEWLASDHVERVSLFSWSGQQLTSVALPANQSAVDIGFGKYPPGSYIVALFYADRKSESFQIIKK